MSIPDPNSIEYERRADEVEGMAANCRPASSARN
jgi:hypothetical protein